MSRTILATLIALLAIMTFADMAAGQSASDTFTLPPTTLPVPAAPAADPDALRAMIREELKAEQKKVAESNRFGLQSIFQNGFVAETEDKAFQFHFGGRFDYDNAWFTQDGNLLIGSGPGTRIQDGTELRRARLKADGRVWDFIDFVAEVNFATIQEIPNTDVSTVPVGSVGLSAFNLAFRDLPVGNLRVGFFKAPYGLERYTSANVLYYMERSSIFDTFFNPNNLQSGLQFFDSYLDDRVTLNTTITRVGSQTLNSFGFMAEDGLYAAGARVTGLPIYEDDGRVLMHLGLNYFCQGLSEHSFALANRMPLRGGAGSTQVPSLLRTGTFFSPNSGMIVDAEWAFVYGPFSMSAEYAVAAVNDVFDKFDGVRFSGPRGNASYSAWYVEGGYFLTPGDRRRYDKANGIWDRTIPVENVFLVRDDTGNWCHGTGAVQLVARLTYLDLTSGSPVLTQTSGGARAGTQRDVTLGVNWYLNSQTHFMVNYVWTRLNSVVPDANGDIHGLGVRLHFDF
jgi:phosphate-selective porin OprO and OprP